MKRASLLMLCWLFVIHAFRRDLKKKTIEKTFKKNEDEKKKNKEKDEKNEEDD